MSGGSMTYGTIGKVNINRLKTRHNMDRRYWKRYEPCLEYFECVNWVERTRIPMAPKMEPIEDEQ